MKLTEVIAIWEKLHVKDTGEIIYSNLHDAIEEVVGVENDIDCSNVSPTDESWFGGRFSGRSGGLIEKNK